MPIPYDAIREARHALANEYLSLSINIENVALLRPFHRKRLAVRAEKMAGDIEQIDNFLKEESE